MDKKHILKMIESLPGVVFQKQQWENGRCVFEYCSGSVETILFVSREEIKRDGTRAFQHVIPSDQKLIADAFIESGRTLERLEVSFRVQNPETGEEIWVRNRATPEKQDDGSIIWFGHLVDISKKMAAEETHNRENSLLRELFKHLPDQIYYKDAEGRLIDANPACCKHHGKSLSEMKGKTDKELYPGKIGNEHVEHEQHVLKHQTILHEQEELVQPDGSIIYLDSVKCALLSHSGKLLGLAGISRDITKEVEKEHALVQAKREAELSAGFIQALFDNLQDQLYYKDSQSRILGGNMAWCKSLNVQSVDALVGKTDLELFPGPLGRELYDAEQGLLQSGEVARKREEHVLENGEIRYVESIKCRMLNEQQEVIGLAGISRDVTDLVNNENNLIEARKAADDANRAKSLFLAMMSHEIRTPMNGIIGAASLLEGTSLSSLQKEFVRTINVSGESLLTLINDILDYSKIEAGKIVLEEISFSLRGCIEDCFDLFVQSAGKKNIELLYHVDSKIPHMLKGDPTRLRQVIINLVGNAVKFTEKGEIVLTVESTGFSAAGDMCNLKFSIRDTGAGIPQEVQGNLFKAFTQANVSDTRKYGGTGLGLTISRRLVELMGGTISFESSCGQGSTFFFDIKLSVADQGRFVDEEQEAMQLLRGKRVLLVEDNSTNRENLTEELEGWGMTIRSFSTSESVLDYLIEEQMFDLALIDFKMPEMDGRELVAAIHEKLPQTVDLPVIMLSNPYEQFPSDPSINAWVSKPVKHENLRDQLIRQLSEYKKADGDENTVALARKSYDLRILVAEDNLLNQKLMRLMLDRLGYENAVIVPDGEDAVAATMDSDYDIILMDIQMPGMNGMDASREIRKRTGCADKPKIMALSAGILDEERKAALDSGMNGFLSKPIGVKQLEEELEAVRLHCDSI